MRSHRELLYDVFMRMTKRLVVHADRAGKTGDAARFGWIADAMESGHQAAVLAAIQPVLSTVNALRPAESQIHPGWAVAEFFADMRLALIDSEYPAEQWVDQIVDRILDHEAQYADQAEARRRCNLAHSPT